jgi:glycosyltransferase involved in cell wall biosynthesis
MAAPALSGAMMAGASPSGGKPLRIVMPIHSFEPGGVERVALHLAEAWQADGCHVTVVLGRRDGALADGAPPLRYVCAAAACSTAWVETLWMMLQMWRYLRAEKADVIFCPGNTYTIVCVAMRLMLGRRCPPIVAKVSNDLARRDMSLPVRWGYSLWLRIQGRMLDRIVGMAEPMRQEIMQAMHVAANRVDIVCDASLTDAQYARLSHCSRPVDRHGAHDFLAVGRLVEQKNFPLMIRAFAEAASSRCTLTILGDGPERDRLRRLIRHLGVERRVRLIGHVADTTPWYRCSNALLLSSSFEGVPAVVIEALAAGLPIIATDCSASMSDLLGGGRFGLLTPVGDVAAFGEAVGRFDGSAFDRCGAVAAARRFTLAGASRQYRSILEQASGATPQASYDKVDSGAMALATMRGRSRA